jgi:hypothetical protein
MRLIDLLTAIGLTPAGSSTVHIYTQTIHRTTQLTTHRTTQLTTHRTTQLTTNWEECGPCLVFASYNLAFGIQLRKKARINISQGRENLGQSRQT